MRLSDRSGIEGLPLRLMIVTLLISLTLPVAIGTLHGFEEQAQVRTGMRLAEVISSAASSIYESGEGNVRLVKLDWPESRSGETLRLRLCGSMESILSSRLDVIVNGQVSGQRFLSDPLVHLISEDSSRLEIGPECRELRLSCLIQSDEIYVSLEVV